MHRSSRYRLYPNQTQERQFAQLCGVDRNSENLAAGWCEGQELMKVPHARIEKYEARARHYQWRASRRQRVELKDAGGKAVCKKYRLRKNSKGTTFFSSPIRRVSITSSKFSPSRHVVITDRG